jgi:hypothetical protein
VRTIVPRRGGVRILPDGHRRCCLPPPACRNLLCALHPFPLGEYFPRAGCHPDELLGRATPEAPASGQEEASHVWTHFPNHSALDCHAARFRLLVLLPSAAVLAEATGLLLRTSHDLLRFRPGHALWAGRATWHADVPERPGRTALGPDGPDCESAIGPHGADQLDGPEREPVTPSLARRSHCSSAELGRK